jgi:hypothetical protein
MASMAESLVIDGTTVVPKGTKVLGRVVDVDGSGRVKGQASIRLALTDRSREAQAQQRAA